MRVQEGESKRMGHTSVQQAEMNGDSPDGTCRYHGQLVSETRHMWRAIDEIKEQVCVKLDDLVERVERLEERVEALKVELAVAKTERHSLEKYVGYVAAVVLVILDIKIRFFP